MADPLAPDQPYRGDYVTVRPLAEGGTARVYLAYQFKLARWEVIKRARSDAGVRPDRLLALFDAEAAALERLQANGAFAPALYWYDRSVPELAMTLIPRHAPLGGLYAGWTTGRFPTDPMLARLGRAVAAAVAGCHARGVVITDLKPDNILVGRGKAAGEVSVALVDFGCSAVAGRPAPAEPNLTPGYGAPELAARGPVTAAADVYSLGAVLFALFRRAEPTPELPPREFGDREAAIHPGVRELVRRMTATNPADRPTLTQVAAALDRLAAELAELAVVPVGRCVRCDTLIRSRTTPHCPACGHGLARVTRVMPADAGGRADPVAAMYRAHRDEARAEAAYFARAAHETGRLNPSDRATALEALLRVDKELDLAGRVIDGLDPARLPAAVRRRFLLALGEYLSRAKGPFATYAEAFRAATADWPAEGLLWVWRARAGPPVGREAVLREGLAAAPRSGPLRRHLGNLLAQTDRPAALAAWAEAVELGETDVAFVCQVVELAWEVDDRPTADALVRRLRAHEVTTLADVHVLLPIAWGQHARRPDREWDANTDPLRWVLALTEDGLRLAPNDEVVRDYHALALFAQGKHELAVEFVRSGGQTVIARRVLGRAQFELRNYAAARDTLAGLGPDRLPGDWTRLVWCSARLGDRPRADADIGAALRAAPADPGVARLRAEVAAWFDAPCRGTP